MHQESNDKFMAYLRTGILIWVLVANAILHVAKFEYGWLIFIGNIFLFTLPGDDLKEKLATVTFGGLVGIVLTYVLLIGIMALTPVLGEFLGFMIPLAIGMFILIICHPKAPMFLNNVGFAYLVCCTMNVEKFAANFTAYLLTFIIGGLIFNIGCLLMVKPCMKLAARPTAKEA